MKTRKYICSTFIMILIAMCLSSTVSAAGKMNVKVAKKAKIYTKTVVRGSRLQLNVKDGKKVVNAKKAKFTSSKKAVATVSKTGVIKARKTGNAVITIRFKKKVAKIKLRVRKSSAKKIPATEDGKITISLSDTTLTVGKKVELSVKMSPDYFFSNYEYAWSSSNKAVATVSEGGVVTGKSAGTAVISASNRHCSNVATCTVTVKEIQGSSTTQTQPTTPTQPTTLASHTVTVQGVNFDTEWFPNERTLSDTGAIWINSDRQISDDDITFIVNNGAIHGFEPYLDPNSNSIRTVCVVPSWPDFTAYAEWAREGTRMYKCWINPGLRTGSFPVTVCC